MNKRRNIFFRSILVGAGAALVSTYAMQSSETTTLENARACILTPDNKPTKAVRDLLDATGIKAGETLAEVVSATQPRQPNGWRRQANKERWEVNDHLAEKDLHALFDAAGLVKEIRPTKKHYTYAVILGAPLHLVRSRIAYLARLIEKGTSFNFVVLLGGERNLDPSIEGAQHLLDQRNGLLPFRTDWVQPNELPINEVGMMKMVYEQSDLPESLRTLPVIIIDAPRQGNVWRATTADTIKAWLADEGENGLKAGDSMLFFSDQPHIGYQHAVLRNYLPETIVLETVGTPLYTQERNSTVVDSLAKWLYEENKKFSS